MTETRKLAVAPRLTDWFAGCEVIVGGICAWPTGPAARSSPTMKQVVVVFIVMFSRNIRFGVILESPRGGFVLRFSYAVFPAWRSFSCIVLPGHTRGRQGRFFKQSEKSLVEQSLFIALTANFTRTTQRNRALTKWFSRQQRRRRRNGAVSFRTSPSSPTSRDTSFFLWKDCAARWVCEKDGRRPTPAATVSLLAAAG